MDYLDNSKNVLLVEPLYIKKYVPLGLAKIATYIKSKGRKIVYSRNSIVGNFDLILLTTLFSTDAKIVISTIKQLQSNLTLFHVPIIVGGIFASLMPKYIEEKTGINIFVGCSDMLDNCLPDYSLDWQVKGFVKDSFNVFTTRGCPNKCGFCMVWKMEPSFKILPLWKETIKKIDKEICIISDNNLLHAPFFHIQDVVRALNKYEKKVIIDSGVDCELITKENAKLLASLKYVRKGFRLAFDDMSQDGFYQKAMEQMIQFGLPKQGSSTTFILFNFNDTPQDAYYRLRQSWKFKSRPYLMKFRPLNQLTKRNFYIGKYWTENLLRVFRYYTIYFGYETMTFEKWVEYQNKEFKKNFLTDEDWQKWNFKK